MPPTDFDFRSEFRNLASSRPVFAGRPFFLLDPDVVGSWDDRVIRAELNASRLQQQANQLFEAGGGYLYFPPGRYLVGRSNIIRPAPGIHIGEFADIVIPENVTLWFAPGATLIPISYPVGREREIPGLPQGGLESRKTRVEIRGDILADIRPIFDVYVNLEDSNLFAGRILLTSLRVREGYPEWWGAFPQDPGQGNMPSEVAIRRTTRALQAAIEAAYVWRTSPVRTVTGEIQEDRAWHRRPAIPVVAQGIYVLHETIRVTNPVDSDLWREAAMPAVDAGGFTLLGERAPSSIGQGSPSFLASLHASLPFAGDSMFSLEGVLGFSIRGVNFNGRHGVPRCVTVAPTRARFSYSEFDSCTFLHPAQAGVVLDAQRVPPNAPVRDFWNQLFTRCRFDQGSVQDLEGVIGNTDRRPRVPDEEGNLVGAVLRLEDNEGIEFRTTSFFGHASPAIRAYSGRFSVNEGNFHVIRAKHPALADLFDPTDPRNARNTLDPRFSPNFRHGTDIFLESDDSQASARRGRIIPAAFTAREVESQSWQFLATAGSLTAPPMGPPRGNNSSVILMNMHHAAVWNRHEELDPQENSRLVRTMEGMPAPTEGPPTPPGIFWGEPGWQGSHLIMIGSQFHGQYVRYRTPPGRPRELSFVERSVVYFTPGDGGNIYTLGSHTKASYAFDPAPVPLTPNTQNYLIRAYVPGEWHRVPTIAMIEAVPTIDPSRIRQLTSQRVSVR